jgi:hypothetical protein
MTSVKPYTFSQIETGATVPINYCKYFKLRFCVKYMNSISKLGRDAEVDR